ncbi:hypothetical protein Poly24_36330 [Rosistilla carotiformis]|uniref:Uncharacterized protein n=1 Tax=Rosistilla carotiformis TaxID=2528017 RepID=A0A518JWL0_9BACT|nr:hypothetical protein Poly24_36330 [Rosistilla carotiformis]
MHCDCSMVARPTPRVLAFDKLYKKAAYIKLLSSCLAWFAAGDAGECSSSLGDAVACSRSWRTCSCGTRWQDALSNLPASPAMRPLAFDARHGHRRRARSDAHAKSYQRTQIGDAIVAKHCLGEATGDLRRDVLPSRFLKTHDGFWRLISGRCERQSTSAEGYSRVGIQVGALLTAANAFGNSSLRFTARDVACISEGFPASRNRCIARAIRDALSRYASPPSWLIARLGGTVLPSHGL